MTINQAIRQIIASEPFKEKAKKDAKLRVFLGRFLKGEIKNGSAIEVLLKFGYKVEIKKIQAES